MSANSRSSPKITSLEGVMMSGAALRAKQEEARQALSHAPLPDDLYQQGQRIIHSTLGRGAVVALLGPADDRRIVIDFDQCGQKELLLSICAGKLSHE